MQTGGMGTARGLEQWTATNPPNQMNVGLDFLHSLTEHTVSTRLCHRHLLFVYTTHVNAPPSTCPFPPQRLLHLQQTRLHTAARPPTTTSDTPPNYNSQAAGLQACVCLSLPADWQSRLGQGLWEEGRGRAGRGPSEVKGRQGGGDVRDVARALEHVEGLPLPWSFRIRSR